MVKQQNLHSIKIKVINGMFVLIVREFMMKTFAVIGQVILVRILLPQVFGIYAIISFVVNAANLFADLGLSQAIIQKKGKLTKEQLSSIFYIRFLMTLLIILIIFIISSKINLIYHQLTNENIWMIRVLGITLLIGSLRSIPIALLEKELEYSVIFIIDSVGIIIYYIFAIFLALNNFNIWSLVLAVSAKEIFELIIVFHYKSYIPSLHFRYDQIKKMTHFGAYLQLGSILIYLRNSIIPVIGGIKFNSYTVGLLDWSSNIASLPNSISENFGRVAFSGFSKIQDRTDILSSSINKSVAMLNIITFLFISLVLGFGRELTEYIFTDKWLPALPALYWFISSTFLWAGTSVLGHAIIAKGKPKKLVMTYALSTIVEWFLAYILILIYGYVGIAMATFASSLLLFSLYFLVGKNMNFKLEFRKPIFDKILVFVQTLIFIMLINSILPYTFLSLIIKLLITVSFYIGLSFIFSRNEIKEMFLLVYKFIHPHKRNSKLEVGLEKSY